MHNRWTDDMHDLNGISRVAASEALVKHWNGAIKSSGDCTSFLPQKSSLELRLLFLGSFD